MEIAIIMNYKITKCYIFDAIGQQKPMVFLSKDACEQSIAISYSSLSWRYRNTTQTERQLIYELLISEEKVEILKFNIAELYDSPTHL